jgi:hypothetical protein
VAGHGSDGRVERRYLGLNLISDSGRDVAPRSGGQGRVFADIRNSGAEAEIGGLEAAGGAMEALILHQENRKTSLALEIQGVKLRSTQTKA